MAEGPPALKTGLTPYLTMNDAKAASAFYQQAFGAEELYRQEAGDTLMHCHLRINGGDLLFSDNMMGGDATPGGYTLHLLVDDADLWFNRAIKAGCVETMKLEDQFWGDRYGKVRDPFGVTWSIAAPTKT